MVDGLIAYGVPAVRVSIATVARQFSVAVDISASAIDSNLFDERVEGLGFVDYLEGVGHGIGITKVYRMVVVDGGIDLLVTRGHHSPRNSIGVGRESSDFGRSGVPPGTPRVTITNHFWMLKLFGFRVNSLLRIKSYTGFSRLCGFCSCTINSTLHFGYEFLRLGVPTLYFTLHSFHPVKLNYMCLG